MAKRQVGDQDPQTFSPQPQQTKDDFTNEWVRQEILRYAHTISFDPRGMWQTLDLVPREFPVRDKRIQLRLKAAMKLLWVLGRNNITDEYEAKHGQK